MAYLAQYLERRSEALQGLRVTFMHRRVITDQTPNSDEVLIKQGKGRNKNLIDRRASIAANGYVRDIPS